ncbi:unnamed protein product [Leuciscus chuanchicus]
MDQVTGSLHTDRTGMSGPSALLVIEETAGGGIEVAMSPAWSRVLKHGKRKQRSGKRSTAAVQNKTSMNPPRGKKTYGIVGTDSETLASYLKEQLSRDVTCQKIGTEYTRYSSFKVTAECKEVAEMYAPQLWPEGTYVRHFYENRKPRAALGQDAGARAQRTVIDKLFDNADVVCLQETFLAIQDLDKLNTVHNDFHGAGESTTDLNTRILRGRIPGGVAIFWHKRLDPLVTVIRWLYNYDSCVSIPVILLPRSERYHSNDVTLHRARTLKTLTKDVTYSSHVPHRHNCVLLNTRSLTGKASCQPRLLLVAAVGGERRLAMVVVVSGGWRW